MFELDQVYLSKLEEIAGEIQAADELEKYLDTEEDEDFIALKDLFEPRIGLIYNEVARKNPLQLIQLELVLLDPVFEGLYLPKILGYAVLRGEVNDNYKYVRPQDHFKEILLAICNSANFDILKKRIGQSIQIGFALSSDIWVTNLINELINKKVRYYLQSQKLDKYRILKDRSIGYKRYKYQFRNEVFMTAGFPETLPELRTQTSALKQFLAYRISLKEDNTSLLPSLKTFVGREEFWNTDEHIEVTALFAYFFELDDDSKVLLADVINDFREKDPEFSNKFFELIANLHHGEEVTLTPDAEIQFSELLDEDIQDDLGKYYELINVVHDKGYLDIEVHEQIKVFYHQNEGVSVVNDCLRQTIRGYFTRLIKNLGVGDYTDYFEATKYFPVYMKIFANQQFNQNLKELSMAYIKKLLRYYTDKRGKDYQDIKKFVRTNFVDFDFLKEKEIVDLFKTKRKKKPASR